ncbi:uncharacterized protein LOC111087354 [Limulus polyphemus]|uniref:Uncharacterized protein LOC111087354 n=1 Tax=Limulus polyphemus TaxID=6850 RepID=A0ABM1T0K9_LIMPO|nr:uncharacterized protein LOC111087354 [Limulus polyphemus]
MIAPDSDLSPSGWNITGFHQLVLQQSITMLAYVDQSRENRTETPQVAQNKHFDKNFIVFVGATAGALGLFGILAAAIVLWNCCYRYRITLTQKYNLTEETDPTCMRESGSRIVQSESVVFIEGSSSKKYETHVIESDELFNLSSPEDPVKGRLESDMLHSVKQRPHSQPIQLSPVHFSRLQIYPHNTATSSTCGSTSHVVLSYAHDINIHGKKYLPHFGECTSYEVLNNPKYFNKLSVVNQGTATKTRSLPLWGRSHPRPLSSEDDHSELFAEVIFSKKRKNRMRNDSAAAIALNRSMTSFPQLKQKDTSPLVDNETFVVYNERTEL